MYTIGEVSEMFNLPISTLRYYDKQGLFPDIKRVSGRRIFANKEIETLRIIDCLKKSGLEIKDIQQFIIWCSKGKSTYQLRKQLFENQKEKVQLEINKLEETLSILQYKCWYYENAINDGGEERIKNINVDELPLDLQKPFKKLHGLSV
jgi:DNA-binding transcriptional MerR regulator